jgi:hypothetical protein
MVNLKAALLALLGTIIMVFDLKQGIFLQDSTAYLLIFED